MKIELIDAVPPVKPDWPATWKSIRNHFGITAFGINGVTKDAGNVLIPEHSEAGSGQQEIYFVHVGEVLVTCGGETATVGAGGLIAFQPDEPRKIEATASPTTLLVVGATPGEPFAVGEWES